MAQTDPPGRPADARRGVRDELITATGWRLVGQAAELVSDPLVRTGQPSLRYEDVLHASRYLLRPRSAQSDGIDVVLSVLGAALSEMGGGDLFLSREGRLSESSGRFHGVVWDTFAHGDRWAGELTWIHPHPVLGGVACTTHVALTDGDGPVGLTVHVGAEGGLVGVRGFVGAGQARPRFLAELNRVALLSFDGRTAEPRTLDEDGIDRFVRRVLLSDRRSHPVAVVAPVEPDSHADPPEYLVPPARLAEELVGLAHLFVIDRHQTTYRLSDALGDRRLSAYWGALRVYLPDFSCADSGSRHPLLVRDRVEDPVERTGLVGELGREARDRIPVPRPVEALREAARPAPAAAAAARPEAVTVASTASEARPEEPSSEEAPSADGPEPEPGPPAAPVLDALVERVVARLEAIERGLAERMDALVDEVARLRTATVVRGANAAGVERRLGELERRIREHLVVVRETGEAEPPPEEEPDEDVGETPDVTLASVVQNAATEHPDALLVLDSAVASAQGSPYEDVQRVAMHLRAMAEIAGRRQSGKLGMSLRDAFAEAGVEYRGHIARSTPQRQRQQYRATMPDGRVVECYEHIVLGAGTYDPRYVLRIYFTSRAPGEPRFVIAHVGRHFDVLTTT